MVTILKYLYHYIVIFLFLLKLPLIGSLTTRNTALVIAMISICYYWKKAKVVLHNISRKENLKCLYLFAACTIIAYFVLPVHRFGTTQYIAPWFFFYEYLHIFIFSLYVLVAFDEIKSFAKVYIGIFLTQAVAVFAAVLNSGIRVMLYELFYVGDDRFENTIVDGSRIMGIGVYASSGSIVCSTICLLLAYMYLNKNLKEWLYILIYTIMLGMTMFIGRTGVLVELVVFIFSLIKSRLNVKTLFIYSIPLLVLPYIVVQILAIADINDAEYLLEWLTGFMTRDSIEGTASVVALKVPPFDINMFFGTGVLRGLTSYNTYVWADSGYVKTYCAIGIIGASMYYLGYYCLFKAYLNRIQLTSKVFFIIIVLISFAIEYKEPYMHRCIFNWIILTLMLFDASKVKYIEP